MKTMLNIKTDDYVKEDAKRVAYDLGLPLSTIVNAYLKELIRHREARFSLEPQLKPEIEKLLKKASQDYKSAKNIVGPFCNASDMDKYLNS
ncbi:MAG: DUF6364 family protein [Patescibacteria group bacterium]